MLSPTACSPNIVLVGTPSLAPLLFFVLILHPLTRCSPAVHTQVCRAWFRPNIALGDHGLFQARPAPSREHGLPTALAAKCNWAGCAGRCAKPASPDRHAGVLHGPPPNAHTHTHTHTQPRNAICISRVHLSAWPHHKKLMACKVLTSGGDLNLMPTAACCFHPAFPRWPCHARHNVMIANTRWWGRCTSTPG